MMVVMIGGEMHGMIGLFSCTLRIWGGRGGLEGFVEGIQTRQRQRKVHSLQIAFPQNNSRILLYMRLRHR